MSQTKSVQEPLPATLPARLRQHAARRPRHAAILAPGFPPLSYSELVRYIDTFGAALSAAGIGRSSRVAVLFPAGPELALINVAVACNAALVACNPSLPAAQISQLLRRLNVSAILLPAGADPPEWLSGVRPLTVIRVAQAQHSLLEASIGGDAAAGPAGDAGPEDTALIIQSSGTTGIPKLVPVRHSALIAMAARIENCFELSHLDRAASLLPLYYSQGIKTACLMPLLLGGSIAIPQAPLLDDVNAWLSGLQPTWFAAGPTFLQALLERVQETSRAPLRHNLRFITAGSAILPERTRIGIERAFGVPLLDAWGMSEVGMLTANSIRPRERKVGSVGYAYPDEIAISSPEGKILSAGETGEIVVRGPQVFTGYIGDDDANRAAFVDGWFRTGDLGSIDADGFLTITGRIKEIINRGGEKIAPAAVERALLSHPDVLEAAVFAVPHARLGEDVAAAVVPHPGVSPTAAELQKFLGANLPQSMIPRSILFLPSLPKGPTGKVLRKELSASCKVAVDHVVAPPSNEIELRLTGLWRQLLEREDIGVEDDFFACGGDSLLAARMVLEAEKITRKLLRGRTLPMPATIRAFAHDIAGAEPLGEQGLVARISGGKQSTPFFFCHGDYLFGGRYAWSMADLLGEEHAVYLINNYNLAEIAAPELEQLAAGYLPAVIAAQPSGPIRLGGHCNGALMAIELSRQLSARGREVELLVLIEPISLNARPLFRRAGRLLDILCAAVPRRSSRRTLRAMTMFQLWRAFRWTCERLGRSRAAATDPSAAAHEPKELRDAYRRLMANYMPGYLSTRVICLTAEGSRRAVEFDWKPWRILSPDVSLRTIPGTHMSCLTTHIEPLAKELRKALESTDIADERELKVAGLRS